jgi:hypothetical protein
MKPPCVPREPAELPVLGRAPKFPLTSLCASKDLSASRVCSSSCASPAATATTPPFSPSASAMPNDAQLRHRNLSAFCKTGNGQGGCMWLLLANYGAHSVPLPSLTFESLKCGRRDEQPLFSRNSLYSSYLSFAAAATRCGVSLGAPYCCRPGGQIEGTYMKHCCISVAQLRQYECRQGKSRPYVAMGQEQLMQKWTLLPGRRSCKRPGVLCIWRLGPLE